MREAVDLREAQTGTLSNRFRGEKRIEYLGNQIGRDAHASIPDRNGNVIALSDTVIDVNVVCSNLD